MSMMPLKKIACLCAAAALYVCAAVAQDGVNPGDGNARKSDGDAREGDLVFTWTRNQMNGERTGVKCPGADNVEEALGRVKGSVYYAPDGKVYHKGCIPDVVRILTDVQPMMADVKKVVGHSPAEMVLAYPESGLSNLFIDTIMAAVEKESGKHVDMGIGNFGGIRVDMPEGDILKDDIMSMFPFRNNIVYVALKGKEVRAILEQMAATRFQVLGGVKVVVKDGELVFAEIGGEPVDDSKVYGVATITFLLDGGDDLHVARNAVEVIEYPVQIYDVMMGYVEAETAAGRDIVYHTDGRVEIL